MWELPPLTPDEILLYSRKSRSDDPLLSVEEVLERHEQRLNEWVERNLPGKGRIPEENRYREVVSGETIESRPQIQKVLRKIESPRFKAVLIVEPQRLSRGDLEDIGRVVKLLRYSNTIVITMDYNYDLRDDRDREQFERELKRGNEYLEYQKKIMGNGRLLSVQNGNFIGNHPPYGYKKVQIKEGKKKCFTLEPIPEEAEAVKLMFDMYAKGIGASRISDRLHEMGYKPRTGKVFAENTVRGILKNEHYLGKVRWNHKKTFKTVEDGEIVAKRSITDDYLVFPGKHPAIIDQETFDAVQTRFGTVPKNNKAGNFSNPFAGILYCSCGKAMRRHSYFCGGVERAEPRFCCPQQKHCENASCKESELASKIKAVLSEVLEDFEVRVEAKEDDSVEVHRQLVARLEKRMADLEALEISQWDKYTQEGMPKHIFDKLNQKVLEEKEEVQQALCTTKDSIPEPINFEEKISTFRAVLELLENPKAPAKELNDLLKSCIERITYSRPKAQGVKARYETGNPIELDVTLKV